MNISICLATYNGEEYIRDQLMSILSQIGDSDELLIGDDGSTDNTIEIVKEFQSKISRIFYSSSLGVNQNFSQLILHSNNDVIVIVDQDDIWLPGRLEKIRDSLVCYDLVITNGFVVDRNLLPSGQTVFDFVGRKNGFFLNLYKNTYVGCALAFKRHLVYNSLPFDEKLHAYDWLIGLLAEVKGKIIQIEEPLFLYRRHDGNYSNTGLQSKNSLRKKIYIRVIIMVIIIRCLIRDLVIKSHPR